MGEDRAVVTARLKDALAQAIQCKRVAIRERREATTRFEEAERMEDICRRELHRLESETTQ
jgi:hypothetical protein